MDWDLIEAKWILGLMPPEAMVATAEAAITEGIDSAELVELAGLGRSEASAAGDLFRAYLGQAGRGNMSKEVALTIYAKEISRAIINGDVPPAEGAKTIWSVQRSLGLSGFHALDGFIYAASEIDDRPKERKTFEEGIIEEARRCLSTT